MRSRTRNPFSTVKTAGLLLPIDLLARIADGNANLPGLTSESYHLDAGDRLNEAAARAWNECSAAWKRFRQEQQKLPTSDAGTTLTRERWLLPLFKELGYGRLQPQKAIPIEDKTYPISHSWGGHIPIHLVSCKLELDKRTPGAAGAASRSPYSLVQELLNRSAQHRWGFLSNGHMLYVLRDNVSLTRAANVEFDLEAMFDGDVFSDFKLLFLLCHESRVEIPSDGKPEDCWLEKWSKLADDQGTRAREKLRDGVENAIKALGAGFLTTKGNAALRERLSSGELATQDYYRQLLRMVYRLLLLLVAEEKKDENGRNLLHPLGTPDQVRQRYAQYYSVGHLRTLAGKRRGTTHTDLYESLKLLFLKLRTGYEPLGIPGLGSFLFSPTATPDLDAAPLTNEFLLDAIRALCITDDTTGRGGIVRRPVDFANLGSDELGSVYESLLELHPKIDTDEGPFSLGTAAGHERKTTGSYYTPTSLINCLLESALDPVAKESLNKPTPAEAEKSLLNLKVCDPACGSGHFLIAAAERLAKYLASLRTGDDEPSTLAIQHAKRDIIGRCIFGVDINPMSVELCQVALWLEALEPGKPFSFLDHHIRTGNSLLGANPELISVGLPDDAFIAIEGDDKKACAVLKKRNKAESKGLGGLFAEQDAETQAHLQQAAAALEELPDDRPEDIRAKELAFRRHEQTDEYRHKKQLADAWCAAFVIEKHFREPGREMSASGITHAHLNDLAAGRLLPADLATKVESLSNQYQFFHWHLAFPEVFAKGGFDCVLGNPPWEKAELVEKEWFATIRPEIANASTASRRKKLISSLQEEDPLVFEAYCRAVRAVDGVRHFIRDSSRYPLCGVGRVNFYSAFAETNRSLISHKGRVGAVLPSGILTDDSTKEFAQDLLRRQQLVSFFDFDNRQGLFPTVQGNVKFCVLTLSAEPHPTFDAAAQLGDPADLLDNSNRYMLALNDIVNINPNTWNCPTFAKAADARLVQHIHAISPVVTQEGPPAINPWGVSFKQGLFNMTTDSHLFLMREDLEHDGWRLDGNLFIRGDQVALPLYEAKLTSQDNHRTATFEGISPNDRFRTHAGTNESTLDQLRDPLYRVIPRYWVESTHVRQACPDALGWFIGFRNAISAVADSRSLVATVVPYAGVGNSMPLLFFSGASGAPTPFVAALNSFVLDYVLRQKASGGNLNFYVFKQLPMPTPSTFSGECSWSRSGRHHVWIHERVLELAYTGWDLEPFAIDCGWSGPPFRWDKERRFLLRCELDAAFFHLYMPTERSGDWSPANGGTAESLTQIRASFPTPRDAVSYIMDTFPIVRRKDEEKYDGDYRTKRTILEIYDAMAEAVRTGRPYQTRLDPPPGPPSEPLPEWKPGQPKPENWPSHIHPPRGCRATPTDEWRLNDVEHGAVLPPSFKLVLEDQEASTGVERRWKCKTIAAADALPESDTWVLLRHPDLMRANKSIPVALGKLTYQELTDANTKQKVMVVTLRGPVPPAQVRIPLEDWPSFRPLAVLEPLDS